jgi:hypothetical protein
LDTNCRWAHALGSCKLIWSVKDIGLTSNLSTMMTAVS